MSRFDDLGERSRIAEKIFCDWMSKTDAELTEEKLSFLAQLSIEAADVFLDEMNLLQFDRLCSPCKKKTAVEQTDRACESCGKNIEARRNQSIEDEVVELMGEKSGG